MSEQQETSNEFEIEDPAAFARNMGKVAAQTQQLLADFLLRNAEKPHRPFPDPLNVGALFTELMTKFLSNPGQLLESQMELWRIYAELWHLSARRLSGEPSPALIGPAPGDRRFKAKEWTENAVFDLIKQSYLVTAQWLKHTIDKVEGLDAHTRQKIDFYTRQFIDALAPTNFVLTNPEVLAATCRTNGENLVKGLSNLLEDLEAGHGELQIRMTDLKAFRLGENIATSRGKVIFRNPIIELLQFEPLTETVHKLPLVIFPPWINKYYILDLKPENSFIRWAVSQGYTVFVVSWCNPGAELAGKSFADYMREGILAAVGAVEQATGEKEMTAIGYCIGGTLLSATLAYMAATGDNRIKAATLFAAQTDFTQAGELCVFIDDEQLKTMEAIMDDAGGVLEARRMFSTFNLLRANDLIWSFVINNYLLGKDPFPFDLLFWNSDQTNLPKALHLFYLRECYQKNMLAKGEMVLDGVPIDLGKIKIPIYLQSAREDHIAPARSVFKSTKLFAGPIRFIVAGSGHIAGVVNPPAANKYQYWTNASETHPPDLETWWAGAEMHPGSWWTDWDAWLSKLAGPKVPARKPGDGKLRPLCDAPGTYVRIRST